MIDLLKPIEKMISNWSTQELRQYLAIYLVAIIILASGSIYWQQSQVSATQKKIATVNKQRTQAAELLSQNELVLNQKNLVASELKKRKQFRLQQYFELLINQLRLQNNLKKNSVFVGNLENLRAQGYSEVRVEASLVNLNTKQLCELLDEIEKNTIIYIKYLEITKSGKAPVIDVLLTIATLQLDKEVAG